MLTRRRKNQNKTKTKIQEKKPVKLNVTVVSFENIDLAIRVVFVVSGPARARLDMSRDFCPHSDVTRPPYWSETAFVGAVVRRE